MRLVEFTVDILTFNSPGQNEVVRHIWINPDQVESVMGSGPIRVKIKTASGEWWQVREPLAVVLERLQCDHRKLPEFSSGAD
jgi:hypothetical protein